MLLKVLMSPAGLRFDKFLVRTTGKSLLNRVFAGQAGFEPRPALLLITTGRHSGKARSAVLPRLEMDGKLMVVGSKGGAPTDPAWIHNLRANPECDIYIDRQRQRRRARFAEGPERERLWELITSEVPIYAKYQGFTERELPVVILE